MLSNNNNCNNNNNNKIVTNCLRKELKTSNTIQKTTLNTLSMLLVLLFQANNNMNIICNNNNKNELNTNNTMNKSNRTLKNPIFLINSSNSKGTTPNITLQMKIIII